jgi:GNAT superfamily N-acetyltransferase
VTSAREGLAGANMVIMTQHVEVKVSDSFAADRVPELMALFAEQWWTKGRNAEDVATMLHHTDLIAAVTDIDTDRLLGFARVITDFTYVAVLLDVIVAEAARGNGFGAMLMNALVDHPRLAEVESLELSCQENLEAFYARWGFTARVGGSRLMRRTASSFFLSD